MPHTCLKQNNNKLIRLQLKCTTNNKLYITKQKTTKISLITAEQHIFNSMIYYLEEKLVTIYL
jgi:hypothetical protein